MGAATILFVAMNPSNTERVLLDRFCRRRWPHAQTETR
jgi:hypothetical protein